MKIKPQTKPYETIERLAALKELLRGQRLTRREIVEALPEYDNDPQFQKFRRDVSALAVLGYRVVRDEFDKRYLCEPPAPQANWQEDELQALATVRELFREGMSTTDAVQHALSRLERGMLPEQRRVYERMPPITASLQATPNYETFAVTLRRLEKGLNKQYMSFEYRPPNRATVMLHRKVQPCALEFRDGHYYLWGYSLERERYSEFRVDRIVAGTLHVLPQRASSPPPRRMVAFQVRLSAKLAWGGTIPRFPVVDSIETDKVSRTWLVTAQDYTDFRIIQTLLRYGEHAEIISPLWLRDKMRKVVEEMGKVYAK